MSQVYVSVTGLRVKGGWARVRFWWLTIPAMTQAKKAPGNISADAYTASGIQHTLSVWRDEPSMRAFLVAGAHRKAMAAHRSLGTGRTYGFLTDEAPDWATALKLWQQHARDI